MPLDRVSRILLLLPSLLAAAACSSAPHPPAKQPDGSYDLSCRGRLTLCLRQAERVCGDKGYTVETARDVLELLGHKQGQSQIGVERSDATIRCGTAEKEPPIRLRREEPQETELPSAPISPRLQACVPGATQACVGPGGCSGGQVCASDGARFESCDCGSPHPASAPVAPAAPVAPPLLSP